MLYYVHYNIYVIILINGEMDFQYEYTWVWDIKRS